MKIALCVGILLVFLCGLFIGNENNLVGYLATIGGVLGALTCFAIVSMLAKKEILTQQKLPVNKWFTVVGRAKTEPQLVILLADEDDTEFLCLLDNELPAEIRRFRTARQDRDDSPISLTSLEPERQALQPYIEIPHVEILSPRDVDCPEANNRP